MMRFLRRRVCAAAAMAAVFGMAFGTAAFAAEESADTVKPAVNAAVSNGVLSVFAYDEGSGISSVVVNGYEYTNSATGSEMQNVALSIRLQQFDAGYEQFTIYAVDGAGNVSDTYTVDNPYWNDADDESSEDAAQQLPESAEATAPTSATAEVTQHSGVDSEGNVIEQEQDDGEEEESAGGKEFYSFTTSSGKVFYLIIDRDGDEDVVYFLTEVSENDLLNVTTDNSETLPKNSAVAESAIPVSQQPVDATQTAEENAAAEVETETETETESETQGAEETETEAQGSGKLATYGIMGIAAAIFFAAAYYFKVARKKKDKFDEEEDAYVEDEEEEYIDEEMAEDGDDGDFFNRNDGEEDED